MPPSSLKLDRSSSVYSRLRDAVIRGRIAPGMRVVEAEIAERVGVSRTPAREAIQRLFQEGFLTSTGTPRRTELVVAPLTSADMWDLYLTMASLEGSSALAIGELEPAALKELARDLRELEAEFERAARERPPDYDKVFDLHNRFHSRLVGVAQRPRLQSIIASVRPLVDRYEWVYAPMVGPDYSATFAEHAEIIQAVRDGSAKRAQQAVVANWEQGAARLARVIDKAGARGEW